MGEVYLSEGGAAFDYAVLTGNVATAAREAADRIRERIRGQQVAIFDIGRDLIAMKEALGHGHFLGWLEAEFGMNERSARRFMTVAEALGSKSDIVSDLPPTVLYALAAPSTPSELREELVAQHEAGQVKADGIRERIQQDRAAERERRADAKRSPGQRSRRRKIERREAQEKSESEERARRRNQQIEAALSLLREGLGERFAEFVAIYETVDTWYFRQALIQETK